MNGTSHVSQAYASSILAMSVVGMSPVIMGVPVVAPVALLTVAAGAIAPDVDIKTSKFGKAFKKLADVCGLISLASFVMTLALAGLTYRKYGELILTRGYQKLTMLMFLLFGAVFIINRLMKHRGITHDIYIPALMVGAFWYISNTMTIDLFVSSMASIFLGFSFGYFCHLFAGDLWTKRGLEILAPMNIKIGLPLVSTGTSSETIFVMGYNLVCVLLSLYIQRDNLMDIHYAIQRFIQ